MSDKNNSDSQNTKTIYIPPEARSQGNYNNQPNRQPGHQGQPYGAPGNYGNQPNRQPSHQGQPYGNPGNYGNQPNRQPGYQGQPYGAPGNYGNQQNRQPGYQGQPYGNHGNYGNQPNRQPGYNGQPHGRDPYYDEPPRRKPPKSKGDHKNSQKNHPSGKKRSSPGKRPKKKRSSFISRFILSLIIIFLLIFGIYSCTAVSLIKKMEFVESSGRSRSGDALSKSYVTNVLLIGTDGRTESETGRSDTMILASVNSKTNKISLISFMRDCYVDIPGYGWDKLNASYSFGGADLLMDTLERNFGIRIDDYISVNFVSFANIVDSVGGIKIDISDAEANEINTILQAEVNDIMGDDVFDDLLSGGGELKLNGKQALSYARIRYVGNADFERTERQRKVIELIMNKMKTMNPSIMSNISKSVMPGVSTNMTAGELYAFSLRVPFLLGYDRQQLQIPAEGTYYGSSTSSGDALIVEFDSNYDIIYDTAFSSQ